MRTGAKCTIDALKDAGVKTLFGLPGGTVLDLFDELARAPLNSSWSATSREPPIWRTATPVPRGNPVAAS